MQERVTPEAMRLRRSIVEHPFATMAYNIKRITNVLGAVKITEALHHA